MNLRQNGCLLEISWDCEHWYTLYDPTDCIAGIAGQPGAGGVLPAGSCREYDVTLRANDRWLLPIPVEPTYTVEITNVQGGWYDGSEIAWRCGDGSRYVLGQCGGATAIVGTDPLPTEPHMEIMAETDSTTPELHGLETQPWTIGADAEHSLLTFHANDSDLSDNSGSVSFHVKVCHPAGEGWCYDFDFLTGDQNWAADPTWLDTSLWTSGEGWSATYSGSGPGDDGISIISPVFATRQLTSISIEFDSLWEGGTNPMCIARQASDLTLINNSGEVGVSVVVFSLGTTASSQINVVVDPFIGGKEAMTQKITRIRLEGLGTNPFGSDNCV
jgi:hypothetical protein